MKKRICILTGTVAMVVLLFVYLHTLFLPGFWHYGWYGDTFLYTQSDGSYAGKNKYADYKMIITEKDGETDIVFSVNGTTKEYQVLYDQIGVGQNVKITENNLTLFDGTVAGADGNYFLPDEFSVKIYSDRDIPTEDELFPNSSELYGFAAAKKHDTRGEPIMILVIFLILTLLFTDIKFPMLGWTLKHGFDVDCGEPSDWWYFKQKLGRIILLLFAAFCMIITFTIH